MEDSPKILRMICLNIPKPGLRTNQFIAIPYTNKHYIMMGTKHSLFKNVNKYADNLNYFGDSLNCFKSHAKQLLN